MQLVLFTGHYPFGSGEEFLENEIRVAEEYFEKITIVTREKNPVNRTRYVPKNAEIVPVRKNMGKIQRFLDCIPCLLKTRVWKEFHDAKRATAYSAMTILKGILIQENVSGYLRRYEREWIGDGADTVYYSYWLGAEFAMNDSCLKGLKLSRAHGGDCFYSRGYHPYRKEALRNLDFIFPISEAGCKDIVAHYENDVSGLHQKVRVARLGIRIPDAFNPFPDKKRKTIVTCSNIIQLKRLDLMIDALHEITDMEIQWIHFGDGSLRETMVQYAEEKLGSSDNIRYAFRGYTPNKEIMDFYKSTSVDLFVNCSDVEGIPVSVMEAMAHGIPAIGRNVGGMEELIDNTCGRLLPEQTTPQALAAAIQTILSLPSEAYTALRANARERIKKDYNAEKNYHALFQFIEEALYADT